MAARRPKNLFFLSSHGFTLIEVLVALAIFSILAAVAIPNWSTLLPTYALNSAARQVQSELHKTKSRAVSENIDFQLKVAIVPAGNYEIQRDGTPVEANKPLPDGIVVTTPVTISFTSRGTAVGGTVKLKNSKEECKHVVVSGTGRIRICKPTSCNDAC